MKKGHNLRDKSVVHHVESPTKTIEFLRGEIKEMEFERLEQAHENAALKYMATKWKKDKQAMQDQIDSAKQGQTTDSGRAIQTDLEDQLKELKLVLKDKEKYIYKLTSCPKNDHFEIKRVKRELNDKCIQIKAMELSFDQKVNIISEKDAVIANLTKLKVALGHQNLELMTKLRAIQREVHPIQNEWKTKANTLEDSLKAEQAEKTACYEKIKKLENLLKHREDSFNIMRKMGGVILQMDDVIENVLPEQNNLELMDELTSVQTEIIQRLEEWKTKVNAQEENVKFEQGEKEACSEKIEDTEEKCAAKQGDSLNQDSNKYENAQKENVKFEQGEKEACSEKIEDTEEKCAAKQGDSLNQDSNKYENAQKENVKFEQGEKKACSEKIEDTEEKCAAKQGDSLNQDSNKYENMELLVVQNTELQEPALTTAHAEAGSKRRRKNRKRK